MARQTMSVSTVIPPAELELAQQNGDPNKSNSSYHGPKSWKYVKKHWPVASQPLALLFLCLILWILCRILLPKHTTIESAPMRMAILFIGAQMCGVVLRLLQWPEMLGMLGFGVFFTNMGWGDFTPYQPLESIFRDLALVNIMLLAGLGIDLKAFVSQLGAIGRLTILPTVGEVVIITLIAKWVLAMTWLWGLLLGLVVTAVSPNVVVDIMLWLKTEKLGLYKDIHTIIIAVTTCNDVLSIFFFRVVLAIIFSTGTIREQLLQGPISIAIGVVYGFVYGLFVGKIVPSKQSKYSNGLRFTMMVLGGLLSVLGSNAIGFPSAGALGCIIIACMCGLFWNKPEYVDIDNMNNNVYDKVNLLWKFVKPISFALIGKEIKFSELDPQLVAYGLLIIVAGLIVRLGIAYASAFGAQLNWKERLYVTISGFPKATVQAALGPVALDQIRTHNIDSSSAEAQMAYTVLIVSVLAIVITAPLGAILMVKLAPKFLQKTQLPPS